MSGASLNVGGFNANVNAKQVNFSDGTVQTTAASGGSTPSGAANLVLATPDGAPGTVALRKVVAADMSSIDIGTF
jgi:hypothetical protein